MKVNMIFPVEWTTFTFKSFSAVHGYDSFYKFQFKTSNRFKWTICMQYLVSVPCSIRRGSIPSSTVLRKSVRFFIINIFLIIKNTFQVEIWPISRLNDSQTQERGFKVMKIQKLSRGSLPPDPLAGGLRLRCSFRKSRSVFILDQRLMHAKVSVSNMIWKGSSSGPITEWRDGSRKFSKRGSWGSE